jgi:hypothetical protein
VLALLIEMQIYVGPLLEKILDGAVESRSVVPRMIDIQRFQLVSTHADAVEAAFPKLGRFLKKEIDAIDQLDEPATDDAEVFIEVAHEACPFCVAARLRLQQSDLVRLLRPISWPPILLAAGIASRCGPPYWRSRC